MIKQTLLGMVAVVLFTVAILYPYGAVEAGSIVEERQILTKDYILITADDPLDTSEVGVIIQPPSEEIKAKYENK